VVELVNWQLGSIPADIVIGVGVPTNGVIDTLATVEVADAQIPFVTIAR